jgi:membrane protein DedA with SNARE-associated domain
VGTRSVTHLLLDYGLALLFLLVAVESAGIPVPGEIGLITAAVLAQRGHYSLVAVIVVAAAAAITGDNIGYWLGRVGGRKLLARWELTRRYAEKTLPPAERFFKKHGGKTVFFGRFVAVLRVTSAWLAGLSRMHWWEFFAWNAAGGIVWATGTAIVAYYFGKAAAEAIGRYGLYAALVLIVVAAVAFVVLRRMRREIES